MGSHRNKIVGKSLTLSTPLSTINTYNYPPVMPEDLHCCLYTVIDAHDCSLYNKLKWKCYIHPCIYLINADTFQYVLFY